MYMSSALRREIEKITGDCFEEAKHDFDLGGAYEDGGAQCICGKEIGNVFTIIHKANGEKYPLGCGCIKHFGKEAWNKKVKAIQYAKKHFVGGRNEYWNEILINIFNDDDAQNKMLEILSDIYISPVVRKHINNFLEL